MSDLDQTPTGIPLRWILAILVLAGVGIFSVQFLLIAERTEDITIGPSEGLLANLVPQVLTRSRGSEEATAPVTVLSLTEASDFPVQLKGVGVPSFSCSRDSEQLVVLGTVSSLRGTTPSVVAYLEIQSLGGVQLLQLPIKNLGHLKGAREFRRSLSAERATRTVLEYLGPVTCTLSLFSDGRSLGEVKVLEE